MKLFTVKEAAEILCYKEASLRNSISKGEVNTIKVLGSVRITVGELERITGIEYKEAKGGK